MVHARCRIPGLLVTAAVGAIITIGCGSSSNDSPAGATTSQDGGPNANGDGSLTNGDGSTTGGDGAVVQTPLGPCTPGNTQCTNCIDDDKDGKFDWQDPECTGPLDNDESSFATGISGDNVDACKQDCFFDGNSGSGNDGCEWEVGCQRPNPDPTSCPDLDPQSVQCTHQSTQKCLDYCLPNTPNGCDCFGCCEVTRTNGTKAYVLLTGTCNVQVLDDPGKCTPCQQKADCVNPCGHCELCVGKTTLPADCAPPADAGTSDSGSPPTGQVCQNGQQVCNATTPCGAGYYCLTGCCAPSIK
jgi:hypothetical protein